MAFTIKQWRNVRGKTQREVAEHFGVTIPTISRWESAPEELSVILLSKIAEFYGVEFKDLHFDALANHKM